MVARLVTSTHLEGAKLRAARARFAESLGQRALDSPLLGTIVLRADQVDAIRRVRARLLSHGGCLLADDPGTGKTYVALAVAREWASPLIVIPASLRATWASAAQRAGVRCALATHEGLSRGVLPTMQHDGIVVDESHRFRATSRRHAALARLASGAALLLLSATPLQNRPRELAEQLALFLGEAAFGMGSVSLARHVVRGGRASPVELPRVAPPRWLSLTVNDGEVLRAILALPPPPRALDMGDGGALLAISLVRAWASSRAALIATVRRRRRTLVAMEQCREEGRVPTRRELRAWVGGDGVQLGFASLLAESGIDRDSALRLAATLVAERTALDALEAMLAAMDDPDVERANALRRLRSAHAGASIIAFSESASTIGAYFRAMRGEAGVGMLTAREARIASGRLARAELLARFAPRAQGVSPPPERERVTLLLTTDLLSEGMNLQDASVVVHLDLPWNPARLAQRVGRVRRPGGAGEVFGYLMPAPAESSLLLHVEHRLRRKLAEAERTIGRGIYVLPPFGFAAVGALERALVPEQARTACGSHAELRGAIEELLESWRRPTSAIEREVRADVGTRRCLVAGVQCESRGWLAVLDDGRIVTRVVHASARANGAAEGEPHPESPDAAIVLEQDPAATIRALRLARASPRPVHDAELAAARAEIDACLMRDWSMRSCGVALPSRALHGTIRRRLDVALCDVPRHRRSHVFTLAARLRDLLDAPMSLGTERDLAAHAAPSDAGRRASADPSADRESTVHDAERWIDAALAIASSGSRIGAPSARASGATAVILLGPGSREADERR